MHRSRRREWLFSAWCAVVVSALAHPFNQRSVRIGYGYLGARYLECRTVILRSGKLRLDRVAVRGSR